MAFSHNYREEFERENELRIALEDRLREVEAVLSQTRADLAASRAETTQAVMHVADWMSQQMFGRKIYAETPVLAEASQEPQIIGRKSQARVLCNQLERQFFEELDGREQ